MSGEPKTGNRLFELVLNEIQFIKDKFRVEVIGWCTDDGPNGKKMWRLLKMFLTWMIVVLCWGHQINLIVGNILHLKLDFLHTISLFLEVIKWFNGYDAAHALLWMEQKFTFNGKFYALILRFLPVVTRWTAHYLSTTRLLKLKEAVKSCCARHKDALLICAGKESKATEKVQSILDIVGNDTFWVDLVKWVINCTVWTQAQIYTDKLSPRIKIILEPLAIAANITQAPHTRHVLLTLGNLYCIYSTLEFDVEVCTAILASLKKWWVKADQEVFILAVFLNPYIHHWCFSRLALTDADLYNMAAWVLEQIFGQKRDIDFLKAFTDYSKGHAEFSDERMLLVMMADMHASEVSIFNLEMTVSQDWEAFVGFAPWPCT